ncbi:MAG TPA: hypothetical protein VHD56_07710 [Tepidisphaeraceae bacterium]|nr:hypothetical protein [Tepidisphaeraceae bacterium]
MRLRHCLLAAGFSMAVATFAMADVTGKVTLSGKAPEPKTIDMSGVKECAAMHADPAVEETIVADDKGNLANVVISVKTDDPATLGGEVPKTAAVIDQKGCMYTPHVLAMMVGQELMVKNDDPFLHNVHSLAQTNPGFNFAQQNKDNGKAAPSPKAPETIKIKCDVHPWMAAWIVVLDNPFFSVSKEDGTFAIKGLPDGDYTLQAWHEKFGTSEQKVSVKGGNATVNFTFKADSAQADPVPSNVKLASDEKTMSCPECDAAAAPVLAKAAPATQPVAMAK